MNNELFDVLGETKIRDFPDNIPHDNYLGFEYDFNQALSSAGFKNIYNSKNPDKSAKGLDLFLKTKSQVEDGSVKIPEWVETIKIRISNLPEEITSVLKS